MKEVIKSNKGHRVNKVYFICSYKKTFFEKHGEIPNDHEIHHIDLNRKNGDINNLVSIPIHLHTKYHQNEREMIKCFDINNQVGFSYHRDVLIGVYNEIMTYKK